MYLQHTGHSSSEELSALMKKVEEGEGRWREAEMGRQREMLQKEGAEEEEEDVRGAGAIVEESVCDDLVKLEEQLQKILQELGIQ